MRAQVAAKWISACILILLAVSVPTVLPARSAHAFGTYNSLGQAAEHEHVTRAALACPAGQPSDNSCFEPKSITQLAGKTGQLGAVGYPDHPFLEVVGHDEAHCDNADYLSLPGGAYDNLQTRGSATAKIRNCVQHMRDMTAAASQASAGLVSKTDRIIPAAVGGGESCLGTFTESTQVKCQVLVFFGRAMHAVQDFYAHSNWTDNPFYSAHTPEDPPGLGLTAHASVLALNSLDAIPDPPADFTTGCFSILPPPFSCRGRVTHATLNKDEGTIDPVTGAATDPRTDRGKKYDNFARAVAGAIAETRYQWNDFRARLKNEYSSKRAERIACVLTHDRPLTDCITLTLKYSADVTSDKSCTGDCDSQGGSVTEDTKFAAHFAAEILLPALPKSEATVASGLGEVTASGTSGSYRRDFQNALAPVSPIECSRIDGFAIASLTSVKPGPFKVLSLVPVLDSNGHIKDLTMHWQISPDGFAGIRDDWHYVETIIGPRGCEGVGSLDQSLNAIQDSYGFPRDPGGLDTPEDSSVIGWTMTPTASDGTVATKTVVFDKTRRDTLGGDMVFTVHFNEHYVLTEGE